LEENYKPIKKMFCKVLKTQKKFQKLLKFSNLKYSNQIEKGRLYDNSEERKLIDEMIRVNHAGELGAVTICKGQLSILKDDPAIKEILKEEQEHYETFNKMISERRVRPTLMHPIWNTFGYLVGAGTALMGREAAMACHKAVESVISAHYEDQLREIYKMEKYSKDEELRKVIRKFRDDELHHYDISVENNAENAPFYQVLHDGIKIGCNVAIWISKKL
jgi:3-demethoxyubiquinol 3-hydroxylase